MTEVKKELTKNLLALSFKELIMKMPFEKITVKMITDGADVIRPTFYKHFQDKYEIIEYILEKEIKDKIQVLKMTWKTIFSVFFSPVFLKTKNFIRDFI